MGIFNKGYSKKNYVENSALFKKQLSEMRYHEKFKDLCQDQAGKIISIINDKPAKGVDFAVLEQIDSNIAVILEEIASLSPQNNPEKYFNLLRECFNARVFGKLAKSSEAVKSTLETLKVETVTSDEEIAKAKAENNDIDLRNKAEYITKIEEFASLESQDEDAKADGEK